MQDGFNDKSLHAALVAAAREQKADRVEALLLLGADPDTQDSFGLTTLMYGAMAGREDIVKIALDYGADAFGEIKNREGETALMVAVYAPHGNNEKIMQLLIKAGAELDARDADGVTPLILATADGSCAQVQLLIDAGAKVDMQDTYGMTALMYAALLDLPEITQCLLEAGASTAMKDTRGLTAAEIAARNGEDNKTGRLLAAAERTPQKKEAAPPPAAPANPRRYKF